jgi:hypothetical protein
MSSTSSSALHPTRCRPLTSKVVRAYRCRIVYHTLIGADRRPVAADPGWAKVMLRISLASNGWGSNVARWVADPIENHELRYWNGRAWTGHVSNDGVVQFDDNRIEHPRRSKQRRRPQHDGVWWTSGNR